MVREDVSITDDGNVLTIQRHPTPITDGIMFGLVVLLFPGLGLTAGFSLASENHLLSAEGSAQLCIMDAVSKRSVGP